MARQNLIIALGALALLVACQNTGGDAPQGTAALQSEGGGVGGALVCDDTSSLKIFDERIAPLLSDDRPSSCNQCHLSGIELKLFVRESPCDAMACLVESELVDFANPEESTILTWIARADPQEELITDDLVTQEYDAFLAWITYSASCHGAVCGESAVCPDVRPEEAACEGGDCLSELHPCVPGDLRPQCAVSDDPCLLNPLLAECAPEVLEPCSEAALADTVLFNITKPWRGRCQHCHETESIINIGDPPKWLEQGDTREAAWKTLQNLEALESFDLEDPSRSKLVLKPLAEDAGGMRHGGGTKLLSTEDPAYRDFLRVAEHYAYCYGPDSLANNE